MTPGLLPLLMLAMLAIFLVVAVTGQPSSGSHGLSSGRFGQSWRLAHAGNRPPPDQILESVRRHWPEDADAAEAVLRCESSAGADPGTWDLSEADGGPMQINRRTWEKFFYKKYGWTWRQVVLDLETHLQAAREIYDRAGGWDDWTCAPPSDRDDAGSSAHFSERTEAGSRRVRFAERG